MKNKKNIKKDIKNLKPIELNKKYKLTYTSWRAMKRREKTHGAVIHKDFKEFRDFLLLMGERATKDITLDRINSSDPEYNPEKVRWASKSQQSNNKSDNVMLTNIEGKTFTLTEWAYKTNQSPNTLRKRRARGWNDTEIITGRRDKGSALKQQPFPYSKQDEWESNWLKYALGGGKLTRIEFLYSELEKEVSISNLKSEFVNLVSYSEHNIELEIEEHIEHSPPNTKKGLIEYCQHLNSLDNEGLRDEKKGLELYLGETKPMLKEVKEQLQYDLDYLKAFKKRPDTLTKGQFRDYYAKLYQRPLYTINIPVSDLS